MREYVIQTGKIGYMYLSFVMAAHLHPQLKTWVAFPGEKVKWRKEGDYLFVSLFRKAGLYKLRYYCGRRFPYHFYYGTKFLFCSNDLGDYKLITLNNDVSK